MNSLQQLLHNIRVRDIISNKPDIIDINCDTTVETTLQILAQHQLLSIPVYGQPEHWIAAGGSNTVVGDKLYIGIVSITDIVAYLLDAQNAFRALESRVVNAIGKTNEGTSLWELNADSTVLDAMEPLSKRVHRSLVVFLSGDKIERCNLIAQIDLARFVWRNLELVKDMLFINFTVRQVLDELAAKRIHVDGVVSVSAGSSLTAALTIMRRADVTAVPVVNQFNRVVASLSLSDFRGLTRQGLLNLNDLSLLQFLSIQQSGTLESPYRVPVTANQNHRFSDVVLKMIENKIHRVWIVDDNDILVDVLSVSDVLAVLYLASHPSV